MKLLATVLIAGSLWAQTPDNGKDNPAFHIKPHPPLAEKPKMPATAPVAATPAVPILSAEDQHQLLRLAYMRSQLEIEQAQVQQRAEQLDKAWSEIAAKYKADGYEPKQIGPADFGLAKMATPPAAPIKK